MATVVEVCATQRDKKVLFTCDVSPPKGGGWSDLEPLKALDADIFCVAYAPGKSVRLDSAIAAYAIKQLTDKSVIFNLATRDMNKIAMQSHLLGAQLLGLSNVVVVGGDNFTDKELAMVKDVSDFRPTELITAIQEMNRGVDYRGLKLRAPTSFCIGATLDIGRGAEREARLTQRKSISGAHFFITQPIYDSREALTFVETYEVINETKLEQPVFWGLQVLELNGVMFGNIPEWIRNDLEKGRSGTDVALQVLHDFVDHGINTIYIIPPILRGGARDYEATQGVIESFKR